MKPLLEQNFYELLEISPDSPEGDIAQAIERSRALWSDEGGPTYSLLSDREREALARRIDDAGRTLLDPSARARYHDGLGLEPPSASAEPRLEAAVSEAVPRPAQRPKLIILEDYAQRNIRPPEPEPREATSPDSAPPAPQASHEPQGGAMVEAEPPVPPAKEPPVAALPPTEPLVSPPAAVPAPEAASRPDPTDFFRSPGDWRGATLRRYREACGVDLKEIARQTRIARMHLENIEADAYERLPAHVYLRGFLESYCRCLKLEPGPLVRGYLEHVAQYHRFNERT